MIEYIAGWESRVERHFRKITLISIYLLLQLKNEKSLFYCITGKSAKVLDNSPLILFPRYVLSSLCYGLIYFMCCKFL